VLNFKARPLMQKKEAMKEISKAVGYHTHKEIIALNSLNLN
jgi:hypothetical protein